MTEPWITLKTCDNSAEAYMYRSVLEQHDITAVLEDLHMAMTHAAGMGGVKLMVAPGDLDRARAVLEEEQSAL